MRLCASPAHIQSRYIQLKRKKMNTTKSKFLLPIILILLFGCDSDKKYKYVEITQQQKLFSTETEIVEKDTKEIKAESDSSAYLKAYEKFCIAIKSNNEVAKMMGESKPNSKPLKFKLINDTGTDIANLVSFKNKETVENEIMKRIMEMDLGMKDIKLSSTKKEVEKAQIDSVKVAKLKKYFKIKSDEFDPNQNKSYTPKKAPKYANRNGIYCYFFERNGYSNNLRLRLQYHSDDWLFIQKVQFSIDGEPYELIPRNTERDSGNGGKIWEWIDIPVNKSTMDIISALSTAKSAKMKLIGKQYHKVKTITKSQITEINRTLEMFYAMGGQI